MSGIIRKHQLFDGDALDYRRIEELFLEAAGRWSQIRGLSIGDKQFRRSEFELDTWQEYRASEARSINIVVPNHAYVVADCMVEVIHDDSFLEAEISWSLDVHPLGALSPKAILAWPVLAGQSLYGGEDMAMCDQLIEITEFVPGDPAIDPREEDDQVSVVEMNDDANITLGNSCIVQAANGRSYAAICVLSIGGFEILKSTLVVRKVLR